MHTQHPQAMAPAEKVEASDNNQQTLALSAKEKKQAQANYELALIYETGEEQPRDEKTAARLYRLAAEQNHPGAQYKLGGLYERGIGVPRNKEEAVRLYQLAAEAESSSAQWYLGWLYATGKLGLPQDKQKALHLYSLSAAQNNPHAQYLLGNMYQKGEGIVPNQERAAYFYQLAAKKQNAPAQYALGNMYKQGQGVQQDEKEAARLYELAANQKYPSALHALGTLYRKGEGVQQDDKKALHFYQLAAKAGHPASQLNLGYMYQTGKGVEKNFKEAIHWFQAAADLTLSPAYAPLASLYLEDGALYNEKEALRLSRLAAEKDDPLGYLVLGRLYAEGRGVARNAEEAVRLYCLAMENEEPTAPFYLGSMYEKGNGVLQDHKEAARLYQLAANQGVKKAYLPLASLYLKGVGVARNEQEAARLYHLAVEEKEAKAYCYLANLYAQGLGVPRDEKEARRFYLLAHERKQDVVAALKEIDLNVIFTDEKNKAFTFLTQAVVEKKQEWVELLLKGGASATLLVNQESAFQLAIKNRDLTLAELLTQYQGTLSPIDIQSFAKMVKRNDYNVLDLLEMKSHHLLKALDKETLALIRRKTSTTALPALKKISAWRNGAKKITLNLLQIAVLSGKEKVVELLLQKNLSPYEPNNNMSPLKLAETLKHPTIKRLLAVPTKEQKVDKVSVKDIENGTKITSEHAKAKRIFDKSMVENTSEKKMADKSLHDFIQAREELKQCALVITETLKWFSSKPAEDSYQTTLKDITEWLKKLTEHIDQLKAKDTTGPALKAPPSSTMQPFTAPQEKEDSKRYAEAFASFFYDTKASFSHMREAEALTIALVRAGFEADNLTFAGGFMLRYYLFMLDREKAEKEQRDGLWTAARIKDIDLKVCVDDVKAAKRVTALLLENGFKQKGVVYRLEEPSFQWQGFEKKYSEVPFDLTLCHRKNYIPSSPITPLALGKGYFSKAESKRGLQVSSARYFTLEEGPLFEEGVRNLVQKRWVSLFPVSPYQVNAIRFTGKYLEKYQQILEKAGKKALSLKIMGESTEKLEGLAKKPFAKQIEIYFYSMFAEGVRNHQEQVFCHWVADLIHTGCFGVKGSFALSITSAFFNAWLDFLLEVGSPNIRKQVSRDIINALSDFYMKKSPTHLSKNKISGQIQQVTKLFCRAKKKALEGNQTVYPPKNIIKGLKAK